jgi:hypothetical protein
MGAVRNNGMSYCRNCSHHKKFHKDPDEFGLVCKWSKSVIHEAHDRKDKPIPEMISHTEE